MFLVHLRPDLVTPGSMAGATAVVIDVLRATTTISAALANGADAILPCLDLDQARQRAEQTRPRPLLGGERQGLKIDGFDLGN
ncbi:MAG: 2-phosphosulfolactate phosphatase, partial [Pirellulaceae bacterium]|nr:2-phosphosulfolactate phosphatase [Pirellulaceae bacterium]